MVSKKSNRGWRASVISFFSFRAGFISSRQSKIFVYDADVGVCNVVEGHRWRRKNSLVLMMHVILFGNRVLPPFSVVLIFSSLFLVIESLWDSNVITFKVGAAPCIVSAGHHRQRKHSLVPMMPWRWGILSISCNIGSFFLAFSA